MATTQTITRNLGGDRLGSGAKNDISLHAYNRSTHDLSRAWRSSMTVGTLVPFLKVVGLNGDTFSIDIDTIMRTIPSKAPLFGSYKLQLDVFECPIRLYNGLLHNNMTKIGLNMAAVKLPKMELKAKVRNRAKFNEDLNTSQLANDSILGYLGLKGIADADFTSVLGDDVVVTRKFNAVPLLAYWDIYKNYYANKQEEKGAFISVLTKQIQSYAKKIIYERPGAYGLVTEGIELEQNSQPVTTIGTGEKYQKFETLLNSTNAITFTVADWNTSIEYSSLKMVIYNTATSQYSAVAMSSVYAVVEQKSNTDIYCYGLQTAYYDPRLLFVGIVYKYTTKNETEGLNIQTFDLQNIDDARIAILQDTGLNNELIVNTLNTPYKETLLEADDVQLAVNHLHGLALKTYQSDLFQNWLKTEWIDGTNGINKITAVDTSSGSFEIDALNLANKVYNMLNRVAVSGGSYEDWQEAVYSVEVNRRAESPIYCGGLSAEIMFNEVVSQAATEKDPLGTLAGKGGEHGKKGGRLEIRCTEPCYIMGIVSITPRVDYSQGNDWDMTELDTLNDLHKPALDGIGFEDLLQERMAYWGTVYDPVRGEFIKYAAGKTPAWMNYMTAVNETHGTFANENETMFMTLNRRYQFYTGNNSIRNAFGIADLTTYIDPTKYNYIFPDANLDAQNFWLQIGMRIEARRVMSGKILPNL